MISPSDLLLDIPSNKYVTYSFKEGISDFLIIIAVVSIFALISMIVSLVIGVRKKDCIAILTGNIMVKTIAVFLYQVLDNLLYIDNGFIVILLFIATIIIEGFIYKKVLKYNKHSGMTVSLICNIGSVIISFLIILIFGSGFRRLLSNLLF